MQDEGSECGVLDGEREVLRLRIATPKQPATTIN